MRAPGLRFHPPSVAFTPEVRWALLRAFGPVGRPVPEQLKREEALDLAAALDLSPRIAARTPLPTLQAEMGEAGARSLLITGATTAMISAGLLACARLVAGAARGLAIPVAFLKGTALRLAGVVEEGSRWLSDVDVLVPAASARALADALTSLGFRFEDVPAQEYQLPPLVRGNAEMVEVHHVLHGVRLAERRRYAELEELRERNMLQRVAELPGACFVPTRELHVAYVLVHGLAQHGLAPQGYPLTRMLADLVDLGVGGASGAAVLESAHELIAGDVSWEEANAARALCVALSAGDETVFSPDAAERPEVVLLRHAVAGLTDDGYRAALRLSLPWDVPTGQTPTLSFAKLAFHTVFLTRGQVDMIYGRPRSSLGYLGRRLARPFDLAWRLARYAASAITMRRQGSKKARAERALPRNLGA